MKRVAAWAGGGAAVVGALALIGRGTFFHNVLVFGLVIYVGVPLAIAGFSFEPWQRKSKRWAKVQRFCLTGALMVVVVALSIPLGILVHDHDVRTAKRYCESLIPKLEAHRHTHGRYPGSVDMIDGGKRPHLLRDRFYGTNGVAYSFTFQDPAGMMNGFQYDSTTQRWEEWD